MIRIAALGTTVIDRAIARPERHARAAADVLPLVAAPDETASSFHR